MEELLILAANDDGIESEQLAGDLEMESIELPHLLSSWASTYLLTN